MLGSFEGLLIDVQRSDDGKMLFGALVQGDKVQRLWTYSDADVAKPLQELDGQRVAVTWYQTLRRGKSFDGGGRGDDRLSCRVRGVRAVDQRPAAAANGKAEGAKTPTAK